MAGVTIPPELSERARAVGLIVKRERGAPDMVRVKQYRARSPGCRCTLAEAEQQVASAEAFWKSWNQDGPKAAIDQALGCRNAD